MTLHTPTLSEALSRPVPQKRIPRVYLLTVGTLLALALAYLIAAGLWMAAAALLAIVPSFVILHRYPLLGLIGWLLAAQFLMDTDIPALRMAYWAFHRALPPVTIIVIVMGSWLHISDRVLPKITWPEFAILGYLIASEFSIIYLSSQPLATSYWLYDRVFIPTCLYFIIRLLAPKERELRVLALALCAMAVAQSLIGMISWVAPQILPHVWLSVHQGDRTTGSLENPAVYTQALALASLFVLHTALNHKPGALRLTYIGAFLLASYAIFISFTRSSWLGALVGMVGLTFLYPKFMIRLILISAIVLGALGGIFAHQISQASARLNSAQSQESALSRLPVFYAALRMFEAKPISGFGYGNFDRYDRQFQGRVANLVNPDKDHASHNLYLTIMAEQGLTGIVLFVMPLFWWFLLSIKALPRLPWEGFWSKKLLIILWLVLAHIFIVNNFFNTIIVYGLGMWWITLGLIGTVVQQTLEAEKPSAASARIFDVPHKGPSLFSRPASLNLSGRRIL